MQRIQTEQSSILIHRFPSEFAFQEPRQFTDPFRYIPHPSVLEAARLLMKRIGEDRYLSSDMNEGKMLGVLVVKDCYGKFGYLAAFSGNVGGRSEIEGFVPAIYDLTKPDGEFKRREAEITALNFEISELMRSDEFLHLRSELTDAERDRDEQMKLMRQKMSASKAERASVRNSCSDSSILADLVKISQFEKAEFKRLKLSCEAKIADIKSRISEFTCKVESLKKKRALMSENLQDWIFRQYKVHNASRGVLSIAEIFSSQGLTAPGGTGECAAPKLLNYAFSNGLKPLAMGEFWFGRSPETAVRTHGHFYPSCTSKCGPLLGWMLKDVILEKSDRDCVTTPVRIYEDDDIIVIEKPCGMPSVPGLDGKTSLLEWLKLHSEFNALESVHRLDMDTSGVMIYAKNSFAAVDLRRQFEEHTIAKTYIARIGIDERIKNSEVATEHCNKTEGYIDLPLSADYDERPRQKVDLLHGKEAHTKYEIVRTYDDGKSDIMLYPTTGRTHQLRVHCAHVLGIGRPILGDRLYGSSSIDCSMATRLHLHALSIQFCHPSTKEWMTFTSDQLIF